MRRPSHPVNMSNNLPLSEEESKKRLQQAEANFSDLVRMLRSFETTMAQISTAMLERDLPTAMKYVKELKEKTIDEQNKNRTVK